jgi:hypothetical protein
MYVTIGCIEWQFDSWKDVDITARLPVSRLIWTMLAFHAVTGSPLGKILSALNFDICGFTGVIILIFAVFQAP